jgi:ureidoglycolate lyase
MASSPFRFWTAMLKRNFTDTETTNAPSGGRQDAPPRYIMHAADDFESFARFGTFVRHLESGEARSDFSQIFESTCDATVPRLHVNRVNPTSLPFCVSKLERHPSSWQTFLPLDVSRYIVCVAEAQSDGTPRPSDIHVWILGGHMGVSFAPGIWHAGAAVLDRTGSFAVIWPRTDRDSDTQFVSLDSPVLIT